MGEVIALGSFHLREAKRIVPQAYLKWRLKKTKQFHFDRRIVSFFLRVYICFYFSLSYRDRIA